MPRTRGVSGSLRQDAAHVQWCIRAAFQPSNFRVPKMINHNQVRLSKLALGLALALAAAPAFAQSTSAGVGGLVTDSTGAPVAGAQVTITHVESGTVSRATTDASGRYAARGLRVGGPYTIAVDKSGLGTDTESG